MDIIRTYYWAPSMEGADGHWHLQSPAPEADKIEVVVPDWTRPMFVYVGLDANCIPYYLAEGNPEGRRVYFHGEAQYVDQP